ncbi:MAG: Hsp20 family protein [Candidatus Marinimicrobia bacterium]|nr:Hsp20 family protein [Candidatus Neomarinimicrobiota bacterium]
MTLVKWNPTRSLITDFDRMLDGIFNDGWNTIPAVRTNSLAVDIAENEKEFTITADFPGFDKKDVNLKIEEGVLTLSADRKMDNEAHDGSFRIRERRFGSYSRSFTLPENVREMRLTPNSKTVL